MLLLGVTGAGQAAVATVATATAAAVAVAVAVNKSWDFAGSSLQDSIPDVLIT